MKRVLFYAGLIWRPLLGTLALLGGSIYLLTYKISSLVSGYSATELGYFNSLIQSPIIPDNPIYLPSHLFYKLVFAISSPNIDFLRVTNALVGLLSIIVLYFVIRQWHTTRVALMVSVMTLGSSWFLLNARAAIPDIMTNLLILFVMITAWLQVTKKRKLAVLASAVVVGLLLYVPGAIWLLILGLVWKHKYIISVARSVPFWYALSSLLLVAILLIPALMNITDVAFLTSASGLPNYIISPREFGFNLYYFIGSLFWNSSMYTDSSIGSQGLIDVFTITMMLAGIIAGVRRRYRARFKLIFAWLGIGAVLFGLGASVSSLFIFSIIMLLVAEGIAWALQQWFAVFPKNPVARNIGVALISAALILSTTYNIYRYFVAWPSMDSTKSSYNLRS